MKILGYDYVIVEDGTVAHTEAFGRYHAKTQKIQIAEDLCTEQKISTILHEIIEALNYHLELKLEHNTIMSLEAGLYQVLKDNDIDLSSLGKIGTNTNEN